MVQKALLIGCNYIGTPAELHGCINDVKNIKQFLLTERGYKESEIRVMTEEATDPKNIPRRDNIVEAFKWLVNDNTAGSKLFLHYSGHGGQQPDSSTKSDEIDRLDETICPLDYSTKGQIIDDDLKKLLIDPLKPGAEFLFLCDACHSASILDLKYCYKISSPSSTEITYSVTSNSNYPATSAKVVTISGCLDSGTSADAFINMKSQGALTYSFLKTFADLKKANVPVTCKRLMKNILTYLKINGYEQVPQISSGNFMDLSALI